MSTCGSTLCAECEMIKSTVRLFSMWPTSVSPTVNNLFRKSKAFCMARETGCKTSSILSPDFSPTTSPVLASPQILETLYHISLLEEYSVKANWRWWVFELFAFARRKKRKKTLLVAIFRPAWSSGFPSPPRQRTKRKSQVDATPLTILKDQWMKIEKPLYGNLLVKVVRF